MSEAETQTFVGELLATGGTTTGFDVPETVVTALGAGKRPKVVVTVGAHSWRSSIAPMGGRFLLGVSGANRAAADIAAGDTVRVRLQHDQAPRVVEVPDDLRTALSTSPTAAAAWERLSYSHQRQHVTALQSAKRPETRASRLAKTLAMLGG